MADGKCAALILPAVSTLTKLEKLFIGEVSGVDDPANETPGWMVQKSVAPSDAPMTADEAQSTLAKIKSMFATTRKDADLDMTADELKAELDARDVTLKASLTEVVTEVVKAALIPAPVEPAAAPVVEAPAEAATALTIEDVTKAIEDSFGPALDVALEPYREILEKAIDRIASVETHFAGVARKSLEGQESGAVEAPAPVAKARTSIGVFDRALATTPQRPAVAA